MPLSVDRSSVPPQTLFLTESTVRNFWRSESSPEVLDEVSKLLKQAREDLFVPLLTQSTPPDFERTFDEFALQYARIRLDALSLLLNMFGSAQFKERYFATLAKTFSRLWSSKSDFGVPKGDMESLQRRYLQAAIVTGTFGVRWQLFEPKKLEPLLTALVLADFGTTALALVYEGTIQANLWRITETFRLTKRAIAAYEKAVSEFLKSEPLPPKISGSLRIEGDLDSILHDINHQRNLRKNKP